MAFQFLWRMEVYTKQYMASLRYQPFCALLRGAVPSGFEVMGRLTPRWSQRRLPLEFMDGLSYTTIIEFAEPLTGRRGSALDRYAALLR